LKGVFEISGSSRYDDAVTERYHFPSNYLAVAEDVIGDWIIYRETRASGGRMAYTGVAFVERIQADPSDKTHFYARVSNYLDFDNPVPYRNAGGRFAERLLRDLARPGEAGRTLRGKSVRRLDQDDFDVIVSEGLASTLDPANRIRLALDDINDSDISAVIDNPIAARRVERMLVNRKVREANFRNHVLAAYDDTCAVTGLKIVNGGGKAEAQAAHIWPVADGGPDIVQNGIALSATAHWLFDRHLITFDDELRLIVSHNKVPARLLTLFTPAGERIRLPRDKAKHPRADLIAKHRERFATSTNIYSAP
jgi:putative restriction endonuclease